MQTFSCLLFLASVATIFGSVLPDEKDGVHDKIKAGLQYATNYLETAKDIADLVAKSLGRKQKEKKGDERDEKEKGSFGTSNIVSAFFRLLGLDSQKVSAIAVNSVIFLAQVISSLFELKASTGSIARDLDEDVPPSWDPAKFITDSKNERIQRLIEQAKSEDLPNQLVERVDGVDSACIRLFVCKTSPVIRAAQKFLKSKTRGKSNAMISWLPDRDEFEENGEECENTHPDCGLFA